MHDTQAALRAENESLKKQIEEMRTSHAQGMLLAETSLDRISLLEAMLETVPIGIVMAEAPSGRIIMGNTHAESLLRHKILTSDDLTSYGEWIAFHGDGRRVQSHEYPLARIISDGLEYDELDVRYQRGDGTLFWLRIVGRPVRTADGTLRGAAVALVDIDTERHLMAQQDVMIAELNHRVKNAFSVVKSIVSQSLRGTDTPNTARATIDARLDAYAKAHSQLIGNRWDRCDIHAIARSTITPIAGGRARMEGPDVWVPSRIGMGLSMAFYELATNAVKHGSLSDKAGRVVVRWDYVTPARDRLSLSWVELDGPRPVTPTTAGFGSKITNQILAAETEGSVALDYPETGFTWQLEMPLNQDEE